MKPIEPGCLALCVAYGSAVEVRVVAKAPDLIDYRCANCKSKTGIWDVVGLPEGYDACCECRLTRIDGYEEPTTTERAVEA